MYPARPVSATMLTTSACFAATRSNPLPPPPSTNGGLGWIGRRQVRVAEMVELAVVAEGLRAPQAADAGERLVQHAPPWTDLRERDAGHADLALGPAGSQTRHHAAVRHLIERREATRRHRRVPEQVAQHEMTDPDARRHRGDDGGLHHGIERRHAHGLAFGP